MTLREMVKQEMQGGTIPSTVNLTKAAEENINFLCQKFSCKSADELLNVLIYHAATTEYTEKMKREINGL